MSTADEHHSQSKEESAVVGDSPKSTGDVKGTEHLSNNHQADAAPETSSALDLEIKEDIGAKGKSMIGHDPITLSWKDLRYTVQMQKGEETVEKEILHGITGQVKPGELIAIMGSSGAGKTTLLNALAARATEKTTGSILLNGKRRTKQFRRQASFVEQVDLLHPNLTVRETLDFQAQLRLPPAMSQEERDFAVEDTLQELGLTDCADTYIGSPFLQGVSGGEKRRVSIGVEIITRPSLIFLDEPTSGLDSTTAYRVVSTIKRLANKNRTVVTTIHQPKSKIFQMFDKVLLLAQGHLIFFGSPDEALKHFEKNGFKCPSFTNPADFYLDVTTPDGESEENATAVKKAITKLSESFKNDYENKLDFDDASLTPDNDADDNDPMFPNPWLRELKILYRRNLVNFVREKTTTVFALFQTLFIALLLGLVYLQLGKSRSDVQNRTGVIFFLIINQSFQPIFQIIQIFTVERAIFRKERRSASYRVSTYFLSKNISEFPFQMLFPFLSCIIVYWMAGLKDDAEAFFTFVGVILASTFTAQSLGLAIAAYAPNFQIANIIAPMCIILFMLFGGFFLNSDDVRPWFLWVKWISWIHYTFRALIQNEFSDTNFDGLSGEAIIEQYGLEDLSIGTCVGIVLVFAACFRFTAYWFLRIKDKPSLAI